MIFFMHEFFIFLSPCYIEIDKENYLSFFHIFYVFEIACFNSNSTNSPAETRSCLSQPHNGGSINLPINAISYSFFITIHLISISELSLLFKILDQLHHLSSLRYSNTYCILIHNILYFVF